MSEKQKDGATLRDHLLAVKRQIHKTPKELEELTSVKCPPLLHYMWLAFLELNSGRGSSGFGPQPLSYQEIESWARLTRRHLTAWQVQLLKRLDAMYLSKQAKQKDKADG